MKWFAKWMRSLLDHNRTAIAAVVTSAAMAGFQSAASGKINWPSVGAAAVTAVAAAAKSPVLSPTILETPAAPDGGAQ